MRQGDIATERNPRQAVFHAVLANARPYRRSKPDGETRYFHSPAAGGQNWARFRLDAYDRLFERMANLPDGPERLALVFEAKRLITAYMPYKYTVHRILTDLAHPWVPGYRRPVVWRDYWHLVDVEPRPAP